MQKKWLSLLLGAVLMGCLLSPNGAQAQSWSEANTQGFFGGYGHFGGYYDTFGGYGGRSAYGYRRFDSFYAPTTSFLSVPLLGPTESGSDTCGWLRQKARETGTRKWKARYAACRSGN